MLKCIKQYDTYWTTYFSLGQIYHVFGIDYKEFELITNEELYSMARGEFLKRSNDLMKLSVFTGKDVEFKQEMDRNNDRWKKIERSYTRKIRLPMTQILGDDKSLHLMCSLTKSELKSRYGSDKLRTTIYFLEDYFIDIQKLRDDKILKLLD